MSDYQAKPVVEVARDLTTIVELYADLMAQALHKANDRLMPGGQAMVALAHVGSLDEWSELVAAAEHRHFATCPRYDHTRCRFAEHVADEDEQEPPLQTMLFWSEAWREQFGYRIERRPTIATEASFIRGALEWAWENETHWENFARDIRSARTRLENLLAAGERAERGVPCMYDACRGARLVRKLVPKRGADGEKVWEFTKWHCPKCKRQWDDDEYARMVTAAHESAKFEDIDGVTWCSMDYAARRVDRPEASIRSWVHRSNDPDDNGHPIATVCIVVGRRQRYVNLADVVLRHEQAKRRRRSAA